MSEEIEKLWIGNCPKCRTAYKTSPPRYADWRFRLPCSRPGCDGKVPMKPLYPEKFTQADKGGPSSMFEAFIDREREKVRATGILPSYFKTGERLAEPLTDEERRANAREMQKLHPGNRFRLMFGMPMLGDDPVGLLPTTLWGPLWQHMHDAHGLILLDDECQQIALAADEARMAAGTPVAMILINALRSLSEEELVTLGKAIAERCGHRLEPAISPTNTNPESP